MSTLSLSTAAELLRLAAEHPDLDLADDAEEAMPLTAQMRGLRDLAEMAT